MSYFRNKDGNDFRNNAKQTKHIAILGAGAIGCYYGVKLAMAGHKVEFLMRSDREATKKTGIKIDSSVEGELFLSSPRLPESTSDVGSVDLVIITLKSTENAELKNLLPPLVSEKTQILTLQNGMGNGELLTELFPNSPIFVGLCFIGVSRVRAGLMKHVTGGQIAMGAASPEHQHEVMDLAAMLFHSKIQARPIENIQLALWSKLIWNVPFNGLCIKYGGIDVETLLQNPQHETEVRALMKEVISAARAWDCLISPDFIEKQMAVTKTMGKYFPSTVLDFLAKRPIEKHSIFEIPLEKAHQKGLDLPIWQNLLSSIS